MATKLTLQVLNQVLIRDKEFKTNVLIKSYGSLFIDAKPYSFPEYIIVLCSLNFLVFLYKVVICCTLLTNVGLANKNCLFNLIYYACLFVLPGALNALFLPLPCNKNNKLAINKATTINGQVVRVGEKCSDLLDAMLQIKNNICG